MVVVEAGMALVSCLLGEGRSVLPSPTGAVENPSAESPVMVHCGSNGPPWAEPIATTSEPSPMGERLMPPRRLMRNSRLPK
jgi:hypothetical protein